MLGQPLSLLLPAVVGIELRGALPGGRDRHRPRADRRRDAAQARCRRQVRRVLRRRRRPGSGREPGDDRQHVARVRLDVHDLPDRRRDAALPARHRPARRSRRAGRDVRQGTGAVARPRGASRCTTRRSCSTSRRSNRRSRDRRARRTASRCRAAQRRVREGVARVPAGGGRRGPGDVFAVRPGSADEASDESFPASDPPAAAEG